MRHRSHRARPTLVDLALPAALLAAGCGQGATSGPDGGADPRTLGPAQDGVATFYAADGSGNCSYEPSPSDLMVAAMNHPQYANSEVCGECVQVQGPRGQVTVRIVDQCPECESGHLDLSREAFALIADPAQGRVSIRWQPVACAVSGPVAFRFKEGSSQWWVAIQVRNHRVPVRALEAQVNGQWVALERQDYNYFVAASGLGTGPFTLRVTATDGQTLTESGVALRVADVVPGTQQFQ
jgi:expansin (peptidoglycan-binding protein)